VSLAIRLHFIVSGMLLAAQPPAMSAASSAPARMQAMTIRF